MNNVCKMIYYVVLKSRMPERCFRPLFQNVVSELRLEVLTVVLTLFLVMLEAEMNGFPSLKLEAGFGLLYAGCVTRAWCLRHSQL